MVISRTCASTILYGVPHVWHIVNWQLWIAIQDTAVWNRFKLPVPAVPILFSLAIMRISPAQSFCQYLVAMAFDQSYSGICRVERDFDVKSVCIKVGDVRVVYDGIKFSFGRVLVMQHDHFVIFGQYPGIVGYFNICYYVVIAEKP